MHPKYTQPCSSLSLDAMLCCISKFRLTPRLGETFFQVLNRSGLSPADVTLTLLRHNLVTDAENFSGCPLRLLPPAMPPRLPLPVVLDPPSPLAFIKVICVKPKVYAVARHYVTPRLDKVRVGLSVEQLLKRGITKRDIREWKRDGVLELSA